MNYMRLKQSSYCEKKMFTNYFLAKNKQKFPTLFESDNNTTCTVILLLQLVLDIFGGKKLLRKTIGQFYWKTTFSNVFHSGPFTFHKFQFMERNKKFISKVSYFSKSCQKDFRECFPQKTELDSFRNWQIFTKHRKNVYDDLIYKVNQY